MFRVHCQDESVDVFDESIWKVTTDASLEVLEAFGFFMLIDDIFRKDFLMNSYMIREFLSDLGDKIQFLKLFQIIHRTDTADQCS